MLRYILLIALALITSSCAFVGVGEVGEVIYKSPPEADGYWHFGGGYYIDDTWTSKFMENDPESNRKKVITPSNVEALWGKPNNTVVDKSRKVITYNRGLRWRGIIPIAIIPIPLVVPVGHKTVSLTFENDHLVNWVIHDSHSCVSYIGFNFIPLDPEGKTLGFKAGSSCGWHKDMSPDNGEMSCNFLFYDRCYPPDAGTVSKGENLK